MGGRARRGACVSPKTVGNEGVALAGISNIRYQLCVFARDVGELVDLAGGWICDRILAGWDVSVAVSEPGDLRPLQILGVTLETQQRLRLITDASAAASIAITPGVFESDNHIRNEVLQALDQGAVEVSFVGPSLPRDLGGRLDRRQHRLSSAARAFKAHALAAAAVPCATMDATEDLHSSARSYDVPVDDETHRRAAGQREDR
jgi:hypothetical protein